MCCSISSPGITPAPRSLCSDGSLNAIPRSSSRSPPPAVLGRWGMAIPAGGGAYFRVLPYLLTRTALRDCERRGVPGTFYIHPWELDPDQPRIAAPLVTRLRHYTGLGRMPDRLARLLREFRFTAARDTVAALTAAGCRSC